MPSFLADNFVNCKYGESSNPLHTVYLCSSLAYMQTLGRTVPHC